MKGVSLVASANRPHLWKRFLNSLVSNKIPYEVIFVGDVRPDFTDPNLNYIYATVRPAQCYEIGFRRAKYDVVSLTADDAEYYDSDTLDIAYDKVTDNRTIVHIASIENGSIQTEWHNFFGKDGGPRMAPFFFMKNDLYKEIGGWDKGFKSGQGENDIIMRGYELGCKVVTVPEAAVLVHHEDHKNHGRIREEYHNHNRKYLLDLWVKDGKLFSKRLQPVKRFEEPISTTEDQW